MLRPIVLAHGLARFDFLFAEFGLDLYFKGVPRHLEKHGFRAIRTRVDFAGRIDKRARDLKAEVEWILHVTQADKVHIIGHSTGGLDARHMIVDHGMAASVASVTTIATPHLGMSFADQAGDQLIALFGIAGVDFEGLDDLKIAACKDFNERAQDAEAGNEVRYDVYSSFQERAQIVAPLQATWQIVRDHEGGENDGLISVASQEWVPVLEASDGTTKTVNRHKFPFPADHLNETGSWDPNELVPSSPFSWNLFRLWRRFQISKYERAVRDVYLGIARDVTAGD